MKPAVTPFFKLPFILLRGAHCYTEDIHNVTTGMHKEVLHILNNDHTFGISDKGKNSALQTYVQKHTFGKTVHLYCEEGD